MKILYITTKFPPLPGGPGSNALALAKRFTNQHKIVIYTLGDHNLPRVEYLNANLQVVRLGHNTSKFAGFLWFLLRVGLKVAFTQCDLIHFHDVTSALAILIVAPFKKRTPKILKYGGDFVYEYCCLRQFKGWNPAFGVKKAWNYKLETRILAKITRIAYANFNIIYSNNEYGKFLLKKLGVKNEVKVIRNGINIQQFDPSLTGENSKNKNDQIVFASGRFVPWKGFEVLIEAFQLLDSNFQLLIAGSGPEEAKLKAKASGNRRIEFIGNVSWNEIPRILTGVDIFVQASLFDWCPNSLLEAMAMGKRVVACRTGAIPEIIDSGENGYLFEPNNASDLAEKILLASKNEMIGCRAREKVAREYNFNQMAKEIGNIYQIFEKMKNY
ncbi:hypothetical protein DRQ12_03535 [candidate division KSB1 bacterium]|nr:MAG: hypothetical protein DRQ12_03535 [candidate division KSB1 bacterium]